MDRPKPRRNNRRNPDPALRRLLRLAACLAACLAALGNPHPAAAQALPTDYYVTLVPQATLPHPPVLLQEIGQVRGPDPQVAARLAQAPVLSHGGETVSLDGEGIRQGLRTALGAPYLAPYRIHVAGRVFIRFTAHHRLPDDTLRATVEGYLEKQGNASLATAPTRRFSASPVYVANPETTTCQVEDPPLAQTPNQLSVRVVCSDSSREDLATSPAVSTAHLFTPVTPSPPSTSGPGPKAGDRVTLLVQVGALRVEEPGVISFVPREGDRVEVLPLRGTAPVHGRIVGEGRVWVE